MKLQYSIGIGTKMIFMVTLIIVLAIGVVVYMATDLFQEDSLTRAQETNRETAEVLGDRIRTVFEESTTRVTMMAQFATTSSSPEEALQAIENTFKHSDDVVSFFAYRYDEKGVPQTVYMAANETALAEFKLTKVALRDKLHHRAIREQEKSPNEIHLINAAPELGIPLFSVTLMSAASTVGAPKDSAAKDTTAAKAQGTTTGAHPLAGRWLFRSEIRQESIVKLFGKKSFLTAYLVDGTGRLMAHSDPRMKPWVLKAGDLSQIPIVAKMKEGKLTNHQMEYDDEEGNVFLGAYKTVGVAGIGVVAEVRKDEALAAVTRVQYRSFLFMVVVVCIAFLWNFGFAHSLTAPLQALFAATQKIVEGQYDVHLRSTTSDEIGALSSAFRNMAAGLKEREKLKGAFNKFHSKEVAQKLLSGDIKLGGERKHATIFFSDIRGFTSMSEKMTPDQVVAMLNEYMTEMVRIIYKNNGVVDKYIGDAIMAVWGVPETKKDDSLNALKASLEMRAFLKDFNARRREMGKPEIQVGIGLHSGEVLAGNIGSEERLEYTVIGDTVNQASRIEAATKALHADLLVSKETAALVRENGAVLGPAISIHVKGKSEALVVHQVIGRKGDDGSLVTSLSADQITSIRNQKTEMETVEESKVYAGAQAKGDGSQGHSQGHGHPQGLAAGTVPPLGAPAMGMPPMGMPGMGMSPLGMAPMGMAPMEPAEWYVTQSAEDPNSMGPMTLSEIILRVRHRQLGFHCFVFRQGDLTRTPIGNLPGLERRDMPPIHEPLPGAHIQNMAAADEWYVNGPGGQTLGPLTVEDLRVALMRGNITRTTYVWNRSLPNWIYLFQIPGFERRGPMPPPAPPATPAA